MSLGLDRLNELFLFFSSSWIAIDVLVIPFEDVFAPLNTCTLAKDKDEPELFRILMVFPAVPPALIVTVGLGYS